MSYEQIFGDPNVKGLYDSINAQLASVGKSLNDFNAAVGATVSEQVQNIGKSLQALGETMQGLPDVTAQRYGTGLKYLGDALDKGPGAYRNSDGWAKFGEWAAKEAVADATAAGLAYGAGAGIAVGLAAAFGAGLAGSTAAISLLGLASISAITIPLAVVALFVFKKAGDAFADALFDTLASPLINFIDPLTLDLDGDGIELTALGVAGQAGASTVYFDFDSDGFAERTGWVKADDGMLALDLNGNGRIDNGAELFGQPTRDGYEVLETYDTFRDGVIDAKDEVFSALRIWRDLNQNGVTDAGELQTLTQAGVTSIALTRTDVTGTNQGNDRGFQGSFTRANGSSGTAETVYFATNRQDTRADNTPGFTPAAGVDKLPQLPGSGQINSIAWKATQDAAFRTAWTGANLGPVTI